MSPGRLELAAADLTLALAGNADGWCQVTLTRAGTEHRLGANMRGYVLSMFLTALADTAPDREQSGEIDGVPVWWHGTLNERHWIVYAHHSAEPSRLYLQDAHSEALPGMWIELSDTERQQWRDQLAAAE